MTEKPTISRFPFLTSKDGVMGEKLIALFNGTTSRDRPFFAEALRLQETYQLSLRVAIPPELRFPGWSEWLKFSLILGNQPNSMLVAYGVARPPNALLVARGIAYHQLELVSEPWVLPYRSDPKEAKERHQSFIGHLTQAIARFREDCGIRRQIKPSA